MGVIDETVSEWQELEDMMSRRQQKMCIRHILPSWHLDSHILEF